MKPEELPAELAARVESGETVQAGPVSDPDYRALLLAQADLLIVKYSDLTEDAGTTQEAVARAAQFGGDIGVVVEVEGPAFAGKMLERAFLLGLRYAPFGLRGHEMQEILCHANTPYVPALYIGRKSVFCNHSQ